MNCQTSFLLYYENNYNHFPEISSNILLWKWSYISVIFIKNNFIGSESLICFKICTNFGSENYQNQISKPGKCQKLQFFNFETNKSSNFPSISLPKIDFKYIISEWQKNSKISTLAAFWGSENSCPKYQNFCTQV